MTYLPITACSRMILKALMLKEHGAESRQREIFLQKLKSCSSLTPTQILRGEPITLFLSVAQTNNVCLLLCGEKKNQTGL